MQRSNECPKLNVDNRYDIILAIRIEWLFEKLDVQGIWLQVRKMKQGKP